VRFLPDAAIHFSSALTAALDKAHRTGGAPLVCSTFKRTAIAALHVPDSESDQVVPVQHGIDGRCEQSQFSDPCGAAIFKKAANSLHLSRRQAISFANYKAFVPNLPLGRDLFLSSFLHRYWCL
jgi:hypothetical protein